MKVRTLKEINKDVDEGKRISRADLAKWYKSNGEFYQWMEEFYPRTKYIA